MREYLTPRFTRFPAAGGDIELLTRSSVIQRLSYTPAQLYVLAEFHGFPPPLDIAPGRVAWRADEIDEWLRARNAKLAAELR